MGLRAEFALHHSGFEAFLAAPLWEEDNGSTLSVLSALARLGMDPWKQAALLAAEPKEGAAETLAKILSRLPKNGKEAPKYLELSERAVELLPAQAVKSSHGEVNNDGAAYTALVIALLGILTVLLASVWGS